MVIIETGKTADLLIGHQTDGTARNTDGTRVAVIEITGHATTVVTTAASGIAQCLSGSVGISDSGNHSTLQTDKLLQAPTVGVEVAAMLGVAVAVSCSSQTIARIIDDHRAEDNLVATVAVDIGDSIVVETVAKPGRTTLIAVPAPQLGQFVGLLVNAKRAELMTRIGTTA